MKKISKTKIATTYAMALYEAAVETQQTEQVLSDVEKLRQTLAEDDQLVRFLANPMMPVKARNDVLEKTAKALGWSEDTLRCMDIISKNRRFRELPLILAEFMHIYYAKNNIAEVEVESVKALSKTQDGKLKANLEALLNKKVVVAYKTTPELIGGLRIKFGSEMIDNSLVSKLNRLENVMKGVQ